MRIALEQVIHVQMGNVCVEQMMCVYHPGTTALKMEIARSVHLGNAFTHNHFS